MIESLRPGAIGNAACAVDANTERYHIAVASTTVTPFDLTTLWNKISAHQLKKTIEGRGKRI